MEQKHLEVIVNTTPPADDWSWIWTGVLVPILIAAIGWRVGRGKKG